LPFVITVIDWLVAAAVARTTNDDDSDKGPSPYRRRTYLRPAAQTAKGNIVFMAMEIIERSSSDQVQPSAVVDEAEMKRRTHSKRNMKIQRSAAGDDRRSNIHSYALR
jgi:hypothetical protein